MSDHTLQILWEGGEYGPSYSIRCSDPANCSVVVDSGDECGLVVWVSEWGGEMIGVFPLHVFEVPNVRADWGYEEAPVIVPIDGEARRFWEARR